MDRHRGSELDGWPEDAFTLPAEAVGDVCPVCRGVIYDGENFCLNCRTTTQQLGTHVSAVWVASTYRKPSAMRDWLTYYKPNDENVHDPSAAAPLARLLRGFYRAIPPSFAGDFDEVATVPSTIRREAPHPLLNVVRKADIIGPPSTLLMRTDAPLAHGHANPNGYQVREPSSVRGQRILLVDDVYTTGARAQSAAHALRAGGASRVQILVLARRLNPDYQIRAQELWDELSRTPYSYTRAASRIIPGP